MRDTKKSDARDRWPDEMQEFLEDKVKMHPTYCFSKNNTYCEGRIEKSVVDRVGWIMNGKVKDAKYDIFPVYRYPS